MTHETNTALVAGALGVAGRALIEHLEGLGTWNIVGLSRRPPNFKTSARFISVDLEDPADCKTKLGGLAGVTHVFFAAFSPQRSFQAEIAPNLAMLQNLVTEVESLGALRHVCLVHGSKWYGNHLGPFKTPAREDDPRHMPPNFYYNQQDWLSDYQTGKAWSWTTYRPHGLCGVSLGSAMNQLMALAIYATISRELGLPLRFPGKPGAFEAVYQFTDARLLARAMLWCSQRKNCENQAFNITNGDVDRWSNIWPALANWFNMAPGPVQTISLHQFMADKQPVWDRIVAKHGLKTNKLEHMVNWQFADWVYGSEFDQISSLDKIRQTGWHESLRSDTMFLDLLQKLKDEKLIP